MKYPLLIFAAMFKLLHSKMNQKLHLAVTEAATMENTNVPCAPDKGAAPINCYLKSEISIVIIFNLLHSNTNQDLVTKIANKKIWMICIMHAKEAITLF